MTALLLHLPQIAENPTPAMIAEFIAARGFDQINHEMSESPDPEARVQYVFVAHGIEQRLVAEGRRRGFSPSVIDRAARVMVQPAGNHPHRNHFHVRIYCSLASGETCRDRAPFHAWAPRR